MSNKSFTIKHVFDKLCETDLNLILKTLQC